MRPTQALVFTRRKCQALSARLEKLFYLTGDNPHERFSILRELIGPIMVPNADSSNCESKRELLDGLG